MHSQKAGVIFQAMGTIHQLIRQHGKDNAKLYADPDEKHLVDIAAEVMAGEREDLGWAYTGWAFTALPHKRVPDDAVWQREMGQVTLTISPGHLPGKTRSELVKVGVPFGAHARLVMLYLQTQAIRTGSREVEVGRTMNAFLERIGVAPGGKTRQSVSEQLRRIAASTVMFSWQQTPDSAPGFMRQTIIKGGQLGVRMTDDIQSTLWEEHIVLSEDFYDNLRKYPIPLLEQAVRAIGASSLALDLYVWLSYRLRSLTKPTPISWQALHAQHGAEYARTRDFKRFMIPQLKLALAAYPQAHVTLEDDGLMLYPSAPPISKLGG